MSKFTNGEERNVIGMKGSTAYPASDNLHIELVKKSDNNSVFRAGLSTSNLTDTLANGEFSDIEVNNIKLGKQKEICFPYDSDLVNTQWKINANNLNTRGYTTGEKKLHFKHNNNNNLSFEDKGDILGIGINTDWLNSTEIECNILKSSAELKIKYSDYRLNDDYNEKYLFIGSPDTTSTSQLYMSPLMYNCSTKELTGMDNIKLKNIKISDAINANHWEIYNDTVNNDIVDDNNCLIFKNKNSNGTDAYIVPNNSNFKINPISNFTGQHGCISNTILFSEEKIGYIVSTANNYKHINSTSQNKINNIKINESLPFVNLSIKSKDKCVFGVISDGEDPYVNERVYAVGAFMTPYKKNKDDNRIYINSVGEGAIWVSDANGPLESGDYITSSDIPGIGMKQDSEFLANYTVAKITMDCSFDPKLEPNMKLDIETGEYNEVYDNHGNIEYLPEYKMKYVKPDGSIIDREEYMHRITKGKKAFRIAFVGCTYHCG